MTRNNFSGRTLVLTGATGGIGRAVAQRFRDSGANLFLIDRDRTALDELAASLMSAAVLVATVTTGAGAGPGSGAAADDAATASAASRATPNGATATSSVHTLALDVSDPIAADVATERIGEVYGGIDFLVPSAGIYLAQPFAQMSDDQWRGTLAVNLDGVFYLTRRLVPLLKPGSAIVNLASMAAHRGAFYNAHYSASKGALLSFTRSIARELAPHTRVNAVSPGIIDTPMTAELLKTRAEESRQQAILKRLGKAEEVAAAIAFLCSDDASFITAEVLHVNGGLYVSG